MYSVHTSGSLTRPEHVLDQLKLYWDHTGAGMNRDQGNLLRAWAVGMLNIPAHMHSNLRGLKVVSSKYWGGSKMVLIEA